MVPPSKTPAAAMPAIPGLSLVNASIYGINTLTAEVLNPSNPWCIAIESLVPSYFQVMQLIGWHRPRSRSQYPILYSRGAIITANPPCQSSSFHTMIIVPHPKIPPILVQSRPFSPQSASSFPDSHLETDDYRTTCPDWSQTS